MELITTPKAQPQGAEPASPGQPLAASVKPGPRDQPTSFREVVVSLNRVAKVVKGGKRFSFSALVVVGDGQGTVGCGLGKAKEVQSSIKKASAQAKKSLLKFALVDGTIPHEVVGTFGAGKVWMKPAAPGTGVIAGKGVRAVLEVGGVVNILTKSLGSANPFSVVYATLEGLKDLRTREEDARLKGKKIV